MFFSTLPLKKTLTLASVVSSSVLLTGCGSLTGLNANDDFSCPMRPGVQCRSLSDTYQDSILRRTPDHQEKDRAIEVSSSNTPTTNPPLASAVSTTDGNPVPAEAVPTEARAIHATDKTPDQVAHQTAQQPTVETTPLGVTKPKQKARPVLRPMSHTPARVPEVIVTIWMAPWTDDEGDFHEGEKIHARAFDARWASARRRADLADNRRAVVQLPYTAIERRAFAYDAQTPTETTTVTPQAYGQGARAFQTAKRKALEGTDFIEKRFQEAKPISEDDSVDELPDDTTEPNDRLGVVAATEHGRLVSQVTNGGSR